MSLRDDFARLGAQLAREGDAALDLWTWLPSYKEAKKYHGDYASTLCPSVEDVMREAAHYFGDLEYPERDHSEDWYACPCGEPHGEAPGDDETPEPSGR